MSAERKLTEAELTAREFPLGVVLSITTGKLLCQIGDVYDILNFLTGDNLFTHQLPRAMRECRPSILAAHPRLADVDAGMVNETNWQSWLADQVIEHGPSVELWPVSDGTHEFIDPLSELAERVHPDNIIVVKAGKA